MENKETEENQDSITEEDSLSSPAPGTEETQNSSENSPSSEVASDSMDTSSEESEEVSSPSSPIDGDMASLPLSEEILKQKQSMMRTKKLTLVGVVGVIALLIIIKVFTGKDGTPRKTHTASFATVPKPPDSGQSQAEPKKQKAQSPSPTTADATPKYKTLKPKTLPQDAVKEKDYFLYGVSRYDEGNNIEAIKAFKMGMKKYPDSKEIGYNNQGVIFAEKRNPKQAIQYFKQALIVNPRYTDAHYNLGAVYEKSGNEQRALFHYQRFLELAKDNYPELAERVRRHLGNR